MFLRNVLLAACLLITFTPQSQNNKQLPVYRQIYRLAERFYNAENPTDSTDHLALLNYANAISILKDNNSDDSVLFDCYLKSGIISMAANQEPQAIRFFLQSIALQKKSSLVSDSLLFKSYLYTGNTYHNISNMDSALYYYNQAEYLINKYPSLSEAERLYNQAGVLYYETGDYKKSITYFIKALSITENHVPVNKYFVVNYKNNIASAYRKIGDYGQAINIYKSLLPYDINKDELFQNIGVTLLDKGNYREAISYLKKVAYNNSSKYNDLGRAYISLHNDDSAVYYLNAALQFQRDFRGSQKNIDYAYTLKYLGDINVQQGSYDIGLEYYQQAIIQADPDFNDTSIMRNPTSFYGLHQSFFLFDALVAKAHALQLKHLQKPGDTFLATSFETYSSALELSRHVERMYNSDEARLFLKQVVDSVYKVEVEVGLQLFEARKDSSYIFKVLKYIEDDKASVLQADLHDLELSKISSLPQGLLQEEKKIKATLSRLNNSVSQTTDTTLVNKLRAQIQDNEIQLASLQARLNDDPSYYKLKFTPPVVNIKAIQEQEQEDEAIISYYYTAKQLLCFFITKDSFGYKANPLPIDMQDKITTLRNELYAQDKGDKEIVNQSSKLFYDILVKPVASIIKDKKHLVVVPYNDVSYIPFEILIDPADNALLLKHFAVSYNYSVNFLQKYKTEHTDYNVLAFAPFNNSTPDKKNFPVLRASGDEVANLPGKVLLGNSATKNNFLKLSNRYPIIHLATHAIVDNTAPLKSFIAFYPLAKDSAYQYNLYENEIYNLDLAGNQLVILSACETGNGQMINGEGIISLSRAFFYSGCRSVATTLWKAEDISITFITKRMHKYLLKGYTKDEALQKAKLDYLNSDDIDAKFKIPGYWAPLVLSGDFNAIVATNHFPAYFIFTFVVIALIFILLFLKKKIKKTR